MVAVVCYTFYRKNVITEPLAVQEFPRIAIKNHLGEYKTINDYKGKTILVDFWFSTCARCLDEMKYFPELLDQYDDLVIMSFSVDSEKLTANLLEKKPKPWSFIDKDNPRWTFYNVDKKEKNGYVDILNVSAFPAYFLIDKEGAIISSPRNAIYSVEKELGGWFSLSATYKNYLDEFDLRYILKIFGVFNLLVVILLPGVFFIKRYLGKSITY